jgi:glutaredoxin 3
MVPAKVPPLAFWPARLCIVLIHPNEEKTMPRVEIYCTASCPYCIMACSLLRKKRVTFEEIDVGDDDDKRAWLRKETGRQTVPQVFIDGKSVGGYDDLAALDKSGQLDVLLGER